MQNHTVIKMFDNYHYSTFSSNRRNDSSRRCQNVLRHQEEIDHLLNMAAAVLKAKPGAFDQDLGKKLEELAHKIGDVG